ncbi:hypothetical protein SAMN04488542_10567 [Fontibacillus panacisegetis]|uniref:Uncharacterized protein n=1 Tax=Fontibacillus panacisegetis TaxID=670482 RepID=A0A1G7HXA0_9BACL|nr:hypothetical protein [Fontibacillus panacisegetis]SDF04973.1 hypothetical protein SAMN04488542_10567 [Fontibacillus panacisegetis]
MSKLREVIAPMLAESGEKTFEDYMIPFSNSGEIYESYFSTILETALQTKHGQDDAYEILAPIASELLRFTKDDQPEIYRLLLLDIKKAHDRLLACQERKEVVIDLNLDSDEVAQSKFKSINNDLDNGWILEVYEDRFEESGRVRAVLLRVVKFQGDAHERN